MCLRVSFFMAKPRLEPKQDTFAAILLALIQGI